MQKYATNFGLAGEDYRIYRKGFPGSFFKAMKAESIGLPGQVILDLGTGTGTLARQFASDGAKVIASDIDQRMLDQADIMAAEQEVKLELMCCSAESVPLDDGSCDVISAGTCWHWFKSDETAKEAKRLLKSRGKILIAHYDWIPIKNNIVDLTEKLVLKYNPEWPFHGLVGIHTEAIKALQESNFVNIKMGAYDEPAKYSHEAWRGRMRASNGITCLSAEETLDFDAELKNLLENKFPEEPLSVHHRVFYIIAEKR